MKILDATTIIAIFNEINCPDLIDKIQQLKHDLVIPFHVMNEEVLDSKTKEKIGKFVEKKQIKISKMNTKQEIVEFQKSCPGLGLGECDSMLIYKKMNNNGTKAYCILDDGRARSKASNLDIIFTGLLGLLKIMHERKIMTKSEADNVIDMLKRSKFRVPTDFVI